MLDLVSSTLSQDNDWEERLHNELFCVEWDVEPQLNQSISQLCLCVLYCCFCADVGSGWLFQPNEWEYPHCAIEG